MGQKASASGSWRSMVSRCAIRRAIPTSPYAEACPPILHCVPRGEFQSTQPVTLFGLRRNLPDAFHHAAHLVSPIREGSLKG